MEDLVDYIAADNLTAAHSVLDRIEKAFAAPAERPGIGHWRPDLTSRRVRFWSVSGRYLIVYRQRRSEIEIVRVLGPGRDARSVLAGARR